MKNILKDIFIAVFVLLIAGNIYIFVSGMSLSDNINRFQAQTAKLQNDNQQLQTEIYAAESLQHAASLSASLKFTQKSQPLYFEQLRYALK